MRLVSTSPTGGEATASTTTREAAAAATREATAATTAATKATAASAERSTASWGTTAPPWRTASAATTSSTTSTGAGGLLDLGRTRGRLGLRKETVEGQELVAADVELVAGLEGLGLDAILGLDGEVDLVQGTADFIDFTDGSLVLEVDGRVEVGNLGVDRLAEHLVLDLVDECAHLYSHVRTAQTLGADCAYRRPGQGGRKSARRQSHRVLEKS